MPASMDRSAKSAKGAAGAQALRYEWPSPAKVNLWLHITGRRPDGYHLLDSLMVPVNLCDRLTIAVEPQSEDTPAISLACSDKSIPSGPRNLAWRAAELLLGETGCNARVRIQIEKVVPAGAGLGGGSGNAGTVLRALNQMLGLGLTTEELERIGVKVGADVPFFVSCRPARIRGIGEVVAPVGLEQLDLIIAVPRVRVGTPWAFAEFDRSLTRQKRTRNVMAFEKLVWRGPRSMANDLEQPVANKYPEISEAKQALLAAGASAAVMSGSGSAVVGLVQGGKGAVEIAARVREATGCDVYCVASLVEPVAGRALVG